MVERVLFGAYIPIQSLNILGKAKIEDIHSYTNYCQPMQAYSRICKNCGHCDETNYCEMHCVDIMDTSTCNLFHPKNKLISARS